MEPNFFARNLKYIRKIGHHTQEDLAKVIRKDRSLIGHWESEKREPTLEDIIKLCNFFMIPMDTFIMNDLTILKKEEIRKLQEKYKQEKEFHHKELYYDEELGLRFEYVSSKPFDGLSKRKQEEVINKIMDELYEYKRELRK